MSLRRDQHALTYGTVFQRIENYMRSNRIPHPEAESEPELEIIPLPKIQSARIFTSHAARRAYPSNSGHARLGIEVDSQTLVSLSDIYIMFAYEGNTVELYVTDFIRLGDFLDG